MLDQTVLEIHVEVTGESINYRWSVGIYVKAPMKVWRHASAFFRRLKWRWIRLPYDPDRRESLTKADAMRLRQQVLVGREQFAI